MSGRPIGSLPAPGEQLGAYQILAEIAQGGMAAVYLARRQFEVGGLGRPVAIKVLLPNLRDREFVDMFLDEARVAVSIAHVNVVQVLDVGEREGWPYLVMEYLRGQPLDRVLRRARERGELEDGLLYLALAQAAAGLHAAHETLGDDGQPLGIVHRDVAPRNIHVGYDGCTKIVDFGIATSRGKIAATRPNILKGTIHYLAPEQISQAHPIDRRTDLWAFGVVAWETLVGERLFRGDHEAATLWSVMEQEIPDLRALAPRIPDSIAEPIMACLQRDPNRRPRDLRELEAPLVQAAQLAGFATTRELATLVSRLFEAERAEDEERVHAAARAVVVTPHRARERAGTEAEPTFVRETEPLRPARRRRVWPAVAGVATLALGGLALVQLDTRAPAARPTAPVARPASRPGPDAPRAAAPATAAAQPSRPEAPVAIAPATTTRTVPPATHRPAQRGATDRRRRSAHATAGTADAAPAPDAPGAAPRGAAPAAAPNPPSPAPRSGPLLDNPYQ